MSHYTDADCACEDFRKAQERYTDNEGWGRLFHPEQKYEDGSYTPTGAWGLGDSLPPPKYCPWCGGLLPPPPGDSPVRRV